MSIKDKIASDLDIPVSLIDQALSVSRSHVKKFSIKKRNGKMRKIFQPAKKLKTIQYWLMYKIFSKLPIHDSAVAYRDGISILHNAERHRENRYFVKIDFTDFFPSIKWDDFSPILDRWHKSVSVDWEYNKEAENLIRNSCFYSGDILPIGYPSSPVISNIVMFAIDVDIKKILDDKPKFGNVVYTRYADDIIISTDKKNVAKAILGEVEGIVQSSSSPTLSVNKSKTKIGSSTGGSAAVTGLKICSNGHITLYRKQKDHIRLLLSLYMKGNLNPKEHTSLLGHLAYVRYVAPEFYSKLQKKYFKEIYELREGQK